MPTPNIAEVLAFRARDRGSLVGEGPTEPDALGDEMTEGVRAHAPTLGDSSELFDEASPQRSGSFEHERVIKTARQRLFGRGRMPQIGRYRIERRLGAGGMGEVYLAHDDDLDRKVAVKRVLGAVGSSAREQQRLRREARALARLSHPNVVQIYEIGEHQRCTFLAMEYVDGLTLGAWLDEEPRPWRVVLERFLAAGRGLAAAHEAGLVHRDFKPDNVLLSSDGSVRVADFGLALAGEEPRASASESTRVPLSPRTRLSVTGAVLGTIRYMPLEQLRGEQVDARSDQFSFCVALYESLYGAPPFSLASSLARLDDLARGVPATPNPKHGSRSGPRPPARLWRVIRRGLSKDPAERWPDMATLLVQLESVTRRRRRLAWIGSVSAALILGAGALVLAGEPEPDPCAMVERELEGVWDEDRRVALARGLGEVEAGHAADSRERIFAGLDRWSQGWVRERAGVCRAGAEHRIEPELARLQSTCLTRQRQQVEDLVDLMLESSASADALAGAVEAVAELPSATACEDELALLGVKPPSPAISREVESLRREVVRAAELRLLGRVDEALELAEQTEREARKLDYGPLQAEALAELAKSELAAGSLEQGVERMLAAIDEAELNRHDHLSADLWTDLTLRTLIELDDAEAGARRLRRAEVANGRVEASARAQARLAFARGQLAELRGDPVGAELGYRAAIETANEAEDAGLERPSYLSNLARLVADRDSGEALTIFRDALSEAEKHHGPKHPHTATLLYDLATAIRRIRPDDPEVVELLEQAAEIWTNSHDRPHRQLAKAELLLGIQALERQDLDAAEAHARTLAQIQAENLPPGHRDHGDAAHLFAIIHGVRGEYDQALEQIDLALTLWEPAYGPDNTGVLRLHTQTAAMLLALGELDRAGEVLDELLPRVEGKLSALPVRIDRCELALRRGELEAAKLELDAIDALDLEDLGGHEFNYALLRAVIGLRQGHLDTEILQQLGRARLSTPLTAEQIKAWLDQLMLDPSERRALHLG